MLTRSRSFIQFIAARQTSTAIDPDVSAKAVAGLICGADPRTLSNAQLTALGRQFCDVYVRDPPSKRNDTLKHIAKEFSLKPSRVVDHVKLFTDAINSGASKEAELASFRAASMLRDACEPKYIPLFKAIAQSNDGVKVLVDLRADVIDVLRGIIDPLERELTTQMNTSLKSLLGMLFSVSLLDIERVTWHSSCDLLQKISTYEKVHPIRHWSDIKKRVGQYRRCFVFSHPAMPREPIVLLHVALTDVISNNIQTLIAFEKSPETDEEENLDTIRCAIFYSVSSTQKGLQGIELGTYLIKKVLQQLKAEIPTLTTFSSLSPIPDFRTWLKGALTTSEHPNILMETEWRLLGETVAEGHSKLLDLISTNSWSKNEDLKKELEPVLMRLCARYLLIEKHRGYALDSVANFHLRNGAVVWRLNWLADTSIKGLQNSCGIMVNYRYYPEFTAMNSKNYVNFKSIRADKEVVKLVGDPPLSKL